MSYQAVQSYGIIRRQTVAPRKINIQRARRRVRLRRLLPPVLLFSTLLLQLCIRVEIIERGYEVERLRSSALKKDAELRQLKLELALATTPRLVSEAAEDRLLMQTLAPDRVRAISEEG